MLSERLLAQLRAVVGPQNVLSGPAELLAYSYDGTFQQRVPDVVVSPATTEEVSQLLRLAFQESVPVIPRGAGTGLAGGTIPLTGGLILNLTRMNRIQEIDRVNFFATVEAGVVTAQLQTEVEKLGLFYPPDPASLNQCTLGGNAACNAGGPRCLKYGVTKDYVLGMTVVLADGQVLHLGGKLLKNVTGYQLAQLFVGSEGTLGVITELILKLRPLPRARSTAAAFFPSLEDAARGVVAITGRGILPVALELMDGTTINLVEDYLGIGLPRNVDAMLVLEQDGGREEEVAREVEEMAQICREMGASHVQTASTPEAREELWRARRAVSAALGRYGLPNRLGEDIVVPRSQMVAMIRRVREIGQEHQIPVPIFGHAGDGNLHPNFLFDLRKPGDLERVEKAAAQVFRAALELGGTLSGEHGIGTLKRDFLEEDMGPAAVSVMGAIKKTLDPKGILNPGKVFPAQGGEAMEGFLAALPTLEGIIPCS